MQSRRRRRRICGWTAGEVRHSLREIFNHKEHKDHMEKLIFGSCLCVLCDTIVQNHSFPGRYVRGIMRKGICLIPLTNIPLTLPAFSLPQHPSALVAASAALGSFPSAILSAIAVSATADAAEYFPVFRILGIFRGYQSHPSPSPPSCCAMWTPITKIV